MPSNETYRLLLPNNTPSDNAEYGSFGNNNATIFRLNSRPREQDISMPKSTKIGIIIVSTLNLAGMIMACFASHLNQSDPEQARHAGITSCVLVFLGCLLGCYLYCATENNNTVKTESMRLA